MMFSMKYDFKISCFRNQGIQFTFTRKTGYFNLTICLAVALLTCQFVLTEKNAACTAVSGVIAAVSLVVGARCYQTESLLILNGLGVTVKKSSLWGTSTRYFDLKYIRDIVIIEAISMQSIYFQLVLIPHDQHKHGDQKNELYPLFKDFHPSLQHLKTVYRHAQEKLIIPREKIASR